MRCHLHKPHTQQQANLHPRRRKPNQRLHPRKRRSQSKPKRTRTQQADYQAINVGTEKPITIKNLAENLIKLHNKPNLQPYVSNESHKSDTRHCYADTAKAQKLLNFKPTVTLEDGLTELARWAQTHGWNATDLFEKALKEPKEKHLAS
jgi:dTDP-D-glucose 4,6-dehydratase